MDIKKDKSKGFTILVTIAVLATVTLLIAFSALLSGIGETFNQLRYVQSKITLAGAKGCMEQALFSLQQNHSYVGETMTIGGIGCTAAVAGSGKTRTVDILVQNQTYTRHLQANVDWTGVFRVTAWHDMVD